MSTPPVPGENIGHPRGAYFQWLAIGLAGSAFAFVSATHLPDQLKLPGVLTVALSAATGWSWGKLGHSLSIPARPTTVAIVGLALLGMQVLGFWKMHQDRVQYLQKKWLAAPNDPISQAIHAALTTERENEAPEQRKQRLQQLAELNAAEEQAAAIQKRRLEFTTLLAMRLESFENSGLTTDPWPQVIWGAELVLASVVGAWLAHSVLKSPVHTG